MYIYVYMLIYKEYVYIYIYTLLFLNMFGTSYRYGINPEKPISSAVQSLRLRTELL